MSSKSLIEAAQILRQARQVRANPESAATLGWRVLESGALVHQNALPHISARAILEPTAIIGPEARIQGFSHVAGMVNSAIEDTRVGPVGMVATTGDVVEAQVDGWVVEHASCCGPACNAPRRLMTPDMDCWPKHSLVVEAGCVVSGEARLEGTGIVRQGSQIKSKTWVLGTRGNSFLVQASVLAPEDALRIADSTVMDCALVGAVAVNGSILRGVGIPKEQRVSISNSTLHDMGMWAGGMPSPCLNWNLPGEDAILLEGADRTITRLCIVESQADAKALLEGPELSTGVRAHSLLPELNSPSLADPIQAHMLRTHVMA